MSSIASWAGSGVALVTAGVCWLLLRHLHHLPSQSHPWLHRAAIAGMYCAGIVFTVTSAGQWIIAKCQAALGLLAASAPGHSRHAAAIASHSGLAWVLVTLGALALIAALLVALIWVPNEKYAYVALAAGIVLALTTGGIVHQVYAASAAPAQSLTSSIATWAGG